MKKLYEFTALIECGVVVAADSEKEARTEVESYERAWFETGDFGEVVNFELFDVRDVEADEIEDLAHVIV